MQPARRAGTDLLIHDAARVYPRAVRDFPCSGIGARRCCGINSLVSECMDGIGARHMCGVDDHCGPGDHRRGGACRPTSVSGTQA
jgi:hypothetical protein